MTEEKERTYNILVYGIQKRGLTEPSEPITARNYTLTFAPIDCVHRFNDFDGVILFQGIFENSEWIHNSYSASYLKHHCNSDELDKRKKEALLLMKNGGFICFLLNEEFIDSNNGRDFSDDDLTKHHLNRRNFHRKNFSSRITHLDIKSDEFRPFLELHGAATSYFQNYNDRIRWRIVAEAVNETAGFIINRNNYFIPCLIPDNRPETVSEFFRLLADGITSSYNKLQVTLPEWVDDFTFPEEDELNTEQQQLQKRISQIQDQKNTLSRFKSSLFLTGDDLAACVAEIFSNGFGLNVDTRDELREDFKVLDNDGNPILLSEVKGINKGVKRDHINQADSHRERSGFDVITPSLLIANTSIRSARTIAEKDQEIATDQVKHAVNMNILVLRTIDLLELLIIYQSGEQPIEAIVELLTNNNGWLRVKDMKTEVLRQ